MKTVEVVALCLSELTPTSVQVQWQTPGQESVGAAIATPASGDLDGMVYEGDPVWSEGHAVTLTGLQPATAYRLRVQVQSRQGRGWAETSFQTPGANA